MVKCNLKIIILKWKNSDPLFLERDPLKRLKSNYASRFGNFWVIAIKLLSLVKRTYLLISFFIIKGCMTNGSQGFSQFLHLFVSKIVKKQTKQSCVIFLSLQKELERKKVRNLLPSLFFWNVSDRGNCFFSKTFQQKMKN